MQKLRQAYWYIVRPVTRGARAIVINRNGEVLLVQHTYTKNWFLPGGGVKKSETPEQAIKHELREEVGVIVGDSVEVLGVYENNYEYKRDTITVFIVTEYEMSEKSHFEIKKSKFFNLNMLPKDMARGTRRRIEEWMGDKNKGRDW